MFSVCWPVDLAVQRIGQQKGQPGKRKALHCLKSSGATLTEAKGPHTGARGRRPPESRRPPPMTDKQVERE